MVTYKHISTRVYGDAEGGIKLPVAWAVGSPTRDETNFLVRLEKQVWAIWLPVVASGALALGFALGTWFASERQPPPDPTNAAQSQQRLAAPDDSSQAAQQQRAKHR